MTKTRVALIFGGRSSEHAISCATAAGVLAAIDREKFEVISIGIAEDGSWVMLNDDPAPLRIEGTVMPRVEVASGTPVALAQGPERGRFVTSDGEVAAVVDAVFPLLHGPFGEDGTLQGLLELAEVPYVGSGVMASATSMDKHVMKVLLAGAGFPVGPYTVITRVGWERDRAAQLDAVAALGQTVFVKPARAGSSMGIS